MAMSSKKRQGGGKAPQDDTAAAPDGTAEETPDAITEATEAPDPAAPDTRDAALAELTAAPDGPAEETPETKPTGIVHDWQPDGQLYRVTHPRFAWQSPKGRRTACRGDVVRLDPDGDRVNAAVAAGVLTPTSQ